MRGDATLPIGVHDPEIVPVAVPAADRRGSRFGEFQVLAPLARGGMGGVYLAVHETTGERVALKVLDPQLADQPDLVARLCAEHTLASRAHHPGVLEIRAARRTPDDVPYLVMEFLDGETLGTLADREPLELATILDVAAQAAAALAALHAAGVVHCDVKHDNVFVVRSPDGLRVKLIDFGVSRLASAPPDDAGVAGTPWCMAPEQWGGRPGPASDVYALGCLLFDLVTGEPPFDGSLPELMIAHLERRPARPSWLARHPMPIELERLILRALAKDPAHRPTMAAAAAELAALAAALGPEALRAAS